MSQMCNSIKNEYQHSPLLLAVRDLLGDVAHFVWTMLRIRRTPATDLTEKKPRFQNEPFILSEPLIMCGAVHTKGEVFRFWEVVTLIALTPNFPSAVTLCKTRHAVHPSLHEGSNNGAHPPPEKDGAGLRKKTQELFVRTR